MTASGQIAIILEDPIWKQRGIDPARIRAAAKLALRLGTEQSNASRSPPPPALPRLRATYRANEAKREGKVPQLTILLTDDERLRELNARFRGKNVATNVLSFPAAQTGRYLGDVAIAFGVAERETATAGVSLEAHTLHLAVHGVLHLLGYDHVRAHEACTMERLETAILSKFGAPNPRAGTAR